MDNSNILRESFSWAANEEVRSSFGFFRRNAETVFCRLASGKTSFPAAIKYEEAPTPPTRTKNKIRKTSKATGKERVFLILAAGSSDKGAAEVTTGGRFTGPVSGGRTA